DGAFNAYRKAHSIGAFPFDFAGYRKFMQDVIEVFSADNLSKLPRSKNDSSLPVFIVSRPRAGSTLVERILSAHPAVHSAGENETLHDLAGRLSALLGSQQRYPHCVGELGQDRVNKLGRQYLQDLKVLGPNSQRITTKALTAWAHLGLASLVTPNACIIDLRRDPVDNGLACYSESLGGVLPFQSDLRLIGVSHRIFERVMDHWHNVLPMRMLRVNYEDLVADPERWIRCMVEFIGLEWHPRCLEFHRGAAASSSAGPTPSYQQVRQPINTSSVGRAAMFRNYLTPLVQGLAEEPFA
ncbi:MAG: sulfotransferase, partial [Phycisphaerales bacterium]|nr:sulfotransferase [Phycisphaerales bacterium]